MQFPIENPESWAENVKGSAAVAAQPLCGASAGRGVPAALSSDEALPTHQTERCVVMTPHWLSVSIRKPLNVVQSLVADYFLGSKLGEDPSEKFDVAGPVRFYSSRCVGDNGISICSDFVQKDKNHCLVNIPGTALEVLPVGGVAALSGFLSHLAGLEDYSETTQFLSETRGEDGHDVETFDVPLDRVFKVTRLDIAFDHVPFSVAQCVDAAKRLDVRSTVQRGRAIETLGERTAGEDGDTFEWGTRRSKSRMVRAYDRRGFVRFELEWRGDRSNILARELASYPVEAWTGRVIGHLRAFLDFVDARASLNICRCPLLPWWAAFVQEHEKIKIPLVKKPSPLVKKIENLVKRVGRSVAVAAAALGEPWVLHHLVTMGKFKFRPSDHRDIAELRNIRSRDPYSLGCEGALGAAVASVLGDGSPTMAQFRLTF